MIYLALALAGTALPLWSMFGAFSQIDWTVWAGLAEWRTIGGTVPSLAQWQVFVTSAALTVWVLAEVAVRRNWMALIVIPVTLLIGISGGLPLYLFLRTRPVG